MGLEKEEAKGEDKPSKGAQVALLEEEEPKYVAPTTYVPSTFFPQRLMQLKKEEQKKQHFFKFLEVFKKLHINLPFIEALEQMSNYAKFLS